MCFMQFSPFHPSQLYLLTSQEETGKLTRAVTDQLQAHIDPFDLDVFMPYLLSALERQLQRSTVRRLIYFSPLILPSLSALGNSLTSPHSSQVLFGMFLALKGSSHLLMGQKPPALATQEKHIVIPLAHTAPRFPSLPTSTTPQQPKPFPKHIQVSGLLFQMHPMARH